MNQNNREQMSLQWPQPGAFRKSIRREFSLYIATLILIIMIATGYVITSRYVDTVTQNVVDSLLLQARSYTGPAGKLILSSAQPDALLLNNLCNKLVQNNPDIYWVGITDENKEFVAHTDVKQVLAQKSLNIQGASSGEFTMHENETMAMHGDTIYLTVPIVENSLDVGTIAVASSVRQIKQARRIAIFTVGTVTLVMILLGIPVTMIMLNKKLKPISKITDSLKAVNFNDFNLKLNIKTKNEFGYLAETLQVMGKRINQARYEALESDRMTRELEIAKEIQRNILPTKFPKNQSMEFAGIYSSAREIGGDYYDFIEFGNGYTGFLVADVSGKSLPGMLVMLLTRDIVKKHAHFTHDPAKLLVSVNEELLLNIKKGMFVTMFIAVIEQNTGKLTFASAGHNPLIVVNSESGETELIKSKGYPLGMVDTSQFEDRIERAGRKLKAGDWLIQFTDGINEAQNSNKEEFGMKRFVDAVKQNAKFEPKTMVERIMDAHKTFVKDEPQFDDITLLVMKWLGQTVDKIDRKENLVYEKH